jgi:hypothetical protein
MLILCVGWKPRISVDSCSEYLYNIYRIVVFSAFGCFFTSFHPHDFVSAIIASSFYYRCTVVFLPQKTRIHPGKTKKFYSCGRSIYYRYIQRPYIHIKYIKLTESFVVMYIGVIVPRGARCYNICTRQRLKTCFMRRRDSIVRFAIGTTACLYKVVVRDEKGRHNIKLLQRLWIILYSVDGQRVLLIVRSKKKNKMIPSGWNEIEKHIYKTVVELKKKNSNQ